MSRQGSALLTFAFRHRYPPIAGELRRTDSIDEASIEVELITGIPAQQARLEALTSLRAYLLARFKDARAMVAWVVQYDRRLALWMILTAVEDRCDLLQRNVQAAVTAGKQYVGGYKTEEEYFNACRIIWPSNVKSAMMRGHRTQVETRKEELVDDALSGVEYALLDGIFGNIASMEEQLAVDAQRLAPILADAVLAFPVRV